MPGTMKSLLRAVKKTGKKQLIIAGIVTDVCVAFAALSAVEAGYEVFVVTDASGTFNAEVRDAAWRRMEAAGVQLVNFLASPVSYIAIGVTIWKGWLLYLENTFQPIKIL